MNRLKRTTTVKILQEFRNGSWLLNVYLIQSDKSEQILYDDVIAIIEKHLCELESRCMSPEFDYFRTGFAFLHYGNRGVDLTIWHYGKWGNTFETYSCSWYCYNRNLDAMELLNSAEPTICQYEVVDVVNELTALCKILQGYPEENFRTLFTEYYSEKRL